MSENTEPVVGQKIPHFGEHVRIVKSSHPHAGEEGRVSGFISSTQQMEITLDLCAHGVERSAAMPDELFFDTEKGKNNSPPINGGARPGAGRPRGSINMARKEQLAIQTAFVNRIHMNADRLLNAALTKALGESFLFHRFKVGSGKSERYETEIITDPETIIDYLNDELNSDRGSGEDWGNDSYYYISTKPVDMVAIKELYDRAFGKSVQRNELSGPEGEPLLMNDQQATQLLALRAKRAD